jgi:hypothetical protein
MLSLFVSGVTAFNVGANAPSTALLRGGAAKMAVLSDFSATTLDGDAVDMSKYKGKPVLICNVASL